MRGRFVRRVLDLALVAVVSMGATSCANLAAIRDFATISSETASYTQLVSDYVASPTVQKRYQPPSNAGRLDEQAATRALQAPQLLFLHKSVAEYMDAMGKLAADEAPIYDKELDSLGSSAKNAKLADEKTVTAATTLGKCVFRAVADGWRRRQLANLVADADSSLQTVVAGLQVVTRAFFDDLDNERQALHIYYEDLCRLSSQAGGDAAAAGVAALKEWRDSRLEAIKARERAINAYGGVLEHIAKGHAKLYAERGRLSDKQLLSEMGQATKQMRELFGAVRELGGR